MIRPRNPAVHGDTNGLRLDPHRIVYSSGYKKYAITNTRKSRKSRGRSGSDTSSDGVLDGYLSPAASAELHRSPARSRASQKSSRQSMRDHSQRYNQSRQEGSDNSSVSGELTPPSTPENKRSVKEYGPSKGDRLGRLNSGSRARFEEPVYEIREVRPDYYVKRARSRQDSLSSSVRSEEWVRTQQKRTHIPIQYHHRLTNDDNGSRSHQSPSLFPPAREWSKRYPADSISDYVQPAVRLPPPRRYSRDSRADSVSSDDRQDDIVLPPRQSYRDHRADSFSSDGRQAGTNFPPHQSSQRHRCDSISDEDGHVVTEPFPVFTDPFAAPTPARDPSTQSRARIPAAGDYHEHDPPAPILASANSQGSRDRAYVIADARASRSVSPIMGDYDWIHRLSVDDTRDDRSARSVSPMTNPYPEDERGYPHSREQSRSPSPRPPRQRDRTPEDQEYRNARDTRSAGSGSPMTNPYPEEEQGYPQSRGPSRSLSPRLPRRGGRTPGDQDYRNADNDSQYAGYRGHQDRQYDLYRESRYARPYSPPPRSVASSRSSLSDYHAAHDHHGGGTLYDRPPDVRDRAPIYTTRTTYSSPRRPDPRPRSTRSATGSRKTGPTFSPSGTTLSRGFGHRHHYRRPG
jgi:hypothetical protein